jgi:drug/metabolite transporter (DMT)-like permease
MMSRDTTTSADTLSFLLLATSVVFTLISTVIFSAPIDTAFTERQTLLLLLIGVAQGAGVVVYFKALKHLSSGTAQIVFSSILFFSAMLGVLFLGAQFTVGNVIGVCLLFGAVALVSLGDMKGSTKSIFLMIGSAFLFACYQVASAAIVKEITMVTYLLTTYLGGALSVLLYSPRLIVRELRATHGVQFLVKISSIAACASMVNIGFAYLAYASAPEPIKVALLLTAQVVVTVFLGYIFLKERTQLGRKLAAALCVVVAAWLIKG